MDLIARLFTWTLAAFIPRRPGRHSAAYLTEQRAPEAAANPWSRPWTGPSAAQVRAVFRPETSTESTLPLSPMQRERRWAVQFAEIGVDYPYSYPGAPFDARAFHGAAVAA
ncbi:hypothetical protein ACWGEU_03155 [Streptomyces goshikiensis]